jgi:hypothetical protein
VLGSIKISAEQAMQKKLTFLEKAHIIWIFLINKNFFDIANLLKINAEHIAKHVPLKKIIQGVFTIYQAYAIIALCCLVA